MFVFERCGRPGRYSAVTALALLVCAFSRNVEAHALLQRSVPENGAALTRAPNVLILTFTEPPEPALSVIHVLDSAGRSVEDRRAQPARDQPLELRLPLQDLPRGVYTVTWRTVSRVDGHVAGGVLSFGVGVAPAGSSLPLALNPPPSLLYVVSRLLLYAGLSGLLATAVTGATRASPIGLLPYTRPLWAAAAVGLVLLGIAQAQDTGAGMDRLLQTPLGHALLWRAVPLAAAGLAAVTGQRSRGFWWNARGALGVSVAAAMLAQVIAGHAGAGAGLRRFWNILEQWAHFVGVGGWIGALAAMLLTARTPPSKHSATTVHRLSIGAAAALGTVGVTGALRAVDDVGTWPALLSTTFGKLLLLKAGLFAVLAPLGAISRRRTLLGAWRDVRALYLLAGAEIACVVGALAVTAFLTGFALPSATQEALTPAPAISAAGSDYATSVRVRLTVTPGLPGLNRFTAAIMDYDTQRPLAADRVTLRFMKPDRVDIGPSSLPLSREADGLYQGKGSNLSLEGRWSVVVLVERQRQSVEVPLELTAGRVPQNVRTIHAPGKPPVYNIDLSGGRTLGLYLDPGKAGFNTVHGTFVDAQGRELILARAPAITARRLGQPPRALPAFQEGPGHFSSDAELGPGEWQLEIAATTRTGETFHARLTIRL